MTASRKRKLQVTLAAFVSAVAASSIMILPGERADDPAVASRRPSDGTATGMEPVPDGDARVSRRPAGEGGKWLAEARQAVEEASARLRGNSCPIEVLLCSWAGSLAPDWWVHSVLWGMTLDALGWGMPGGEPQRRLVALYVRCALDRVRMASQRERAYLFLRVALHHDPRQLVEDSGALEIVLRDARSGAGQVRHHALWLLTLQRLANGGELWADLLRDEDVEVRRLALAAVAGGRAEPVDWQRVAAMLGSADATEAMAAARAVLLRCTRVDILERALKCLWSGGDQGWMSDAALCAWKSAEPRAIAGVLRDLEADGVLENLDAEGKRAFMMMLTASDYRARGVTGDEEMERLGERWATGLVPRAESWLEWIGSVGMSSYGDVLSAEEAWRVLGRIQLLEAAGDERAREWQRALAHTDVWEGDAQPRMRGWWPELLEALR